MVGARGQLADRQTDSPWLWSDGQRVQRVALTLYFTESLHGTGWVKINRTISDC